MGNKKSLEAFRYGFELDKMNLSDSNKGGIIRLLKPRFMSLVDFPEYIKNCQTACNSCPIITDRENLKGMGMDVIKLFQNVTSINCSRIDLEGRADVSIEDFIDQGVLMFRILKKRETPCSKLRLMRVRSNTNRGRH
jgi:hypothetical protein